jgi:hypothetical protein
MSDDEIIKSLEEYRLQKAAGQMQNMVAQAMFGVQSAVPVAPRSRMIEILEQVAEADQKSVLNFQDRSNEQSQAVLSILLDLQ